eukprot:CAMPEP_0184368858 /NCGR_PEP_ID=MMETSP1089-20130417/161914_1 /TAXON_ID=38269 ORGANISM="Gloeochaete wittrockiana, Strain SAG46.84" /NCGR_SAMPLE_ID=MMETSP1089 /ASSEMBLY_ACC=CAM_ASM_000445 /LENGTH=407 /DNA_ID=CAMNT_0026711221 /DNA_START=188 /DNA_END=1411 /DNA_ORIENTATION=-
MDFEATAELIGVSPDTLKLACKRYNMENAFSAAPTRPRGKKRGVKMPKPALLNEEPKQQPDVVVPKPVPRCNPSPALPLLSTSISLLPKSQTVNLIPPPATLTQFYPTYTNILPTTGPFPPSPPPPSKQIKAPHMSNSSNSGFPSSSLSGLSTTMVPSMPSFNTIYTAHPYSIAPGCQSPSHSIEATSASASMSNSRLTLPHDLPTLVPVSTRKKRKRPSCSTETSPPLAKQVPYCRIEPHLPSLGSLQFPTYPEYDRQHHPPHLLLSKPMAADGTSRGQRPPPHVLFSKPVAAAEGTSRGHHHPPHILPFSKSVAAEGTSRGHSLAADGTSRGQHPFHVPMPSPFLLLAQQKFEDRLNVLAEVASCAAYVKGPGEDFRLEAQSRSWPGPQFPNTAFPSLYALPMAR